MTLLVLFLLFFLFPYVCNLNYSTMANTDPLGGIKVLLLSACVSAHWLLKWIRDETDKTD